MSLIDVVRHTAPVNHDYRDRKRNSFRDNHVKQFGNKRSFSSEPAPRYDQRRESPTSKRRRVNSNKIDDEYHEYERQANLSLNFVYDLFQFEFGRRR